MARPLTLFESVIKRLVEAEVNGTSRHLLGRAITNRVWRKVTEWTTDSEGFDKENFGADSPPVADLGDANIVTSESGFKEGHHNPVIDLDVSHAYVASSSHGHGHLYLDLDLNEAEWREFMIMLEQFGVIQKGYLDASLRRGYSAVRLPLVKKGL